MTTYTVQTKTDSSGATYEVPATLGAFTSFYEAEKYAKAETENRGVWIRSENGEIFSSDYLTGKFIKQYG
jgi:hypothetical protein